MAACHFGEWSLFVISPYRPPWFGLMAPLKNLNGRNLQQMLGSRALGH